MMRTEYCGAFGAGHLGTRAKACGWVAAKRDMGGVIFIDLCDYKGTLQVVLSANNLSPEMFAAAERLSPQSVVGVEGFVCPRDEETVNPKLPTGTIELRAEALTVYSKAAPLPFAPGDGTQKEELRLRHRYIDLRSARMQRNLRFRHRVQKAAERYLDKEGFLCVETPMLTKSTPEGARDYLVPSRVHKGSFFALPQSPQIFKQLLMVGGVDRYYQVARCFRDEDLRADRQPEFTQIDLEMSFVRQEDVLRQLEALFKAVFEDAMERPLQGPFPRLTWQQAMDTYGSDKPDLRFGLPITDVTEIARECGFSVFRKAVQSGGVVRAICVPGGAAISRGDIEHLTRRAEGYGAWGMAWVALREDGGLNTILTKHMTTAEMDAILQKTGAKAGDFVLFCADALTTVRRTLGGLRGDVADLLALRQKGDFRFAFITDFPQFEYAEEEGRFVATHHPFTMPNPEDVDKLESDPGGVRALAYDVVLNGVELGSGSMRIHSSELQARMFKALGLSGAEIEEKFGFLVEAFAGGTPPHGGFAFGLDRLVMLLLEEKSLREVIAFPKTKEAACPLTKAPGPVDKEQLAVLGIALEQEGGTGAMQEKKNSPPRIDVENVAHLARLWLSEEEKTQMAADMETIVDFAGALSAIDTEGVRPTAHAVPLQNVLRQDVMQPSQPLSEVLANAPATHEGFVLVPRVLEEGEG